MTNRAELKVLIACEFSGAVTDAFIDMGYDAYSCDIRASEGRYPHRHFQQDVRPLLKRTDWDLIIVAHPPCTRLCNSGVRWLKTAPTKLNPEHHTPEECAAYQLMETEAERLEFMWKKLDEGAELFSECLNAPCPRIAVENPVMHKHAKERIEGYVEFAQSIQPWEYGHPETKRTCLWLKGLPKLEPTNIVEGREQRVHNMSPGPNRGKERSKFFTGVAEAMAKQWGEFAENQIHQEGAMV